ncbi:unnamed protein product [Cylindrotheca closterium]|uniref:Uncharacterized protein n=1 Tax=Cylindrotheca closterium TaxID=2856 RepID=A0AAD2CKD5_9STRA|nr:unnamed protein product [Cylindrotheca closterium]
MSTNKRRVQFNPSHDSVLEISNREEYTEQEILNYWYTKPEFKAITTRCYKQASRWESGKSSKNESFHRGLEGFTQEAEEITTASIEQCIDSVMDEQDAQWEEEVDDCDRLAAVSKEVSRFSVAWALEKAIADEQDAQNIYRRMEQKTKLQLKTKSSKGSSGLDSSDHTSICSDLSHPEADSVRSRESSSGTRVNKKGTQSITRRVTKALKMPKLAVGASPLLGVSR